MIKFVEQFRFERLGVFTYSLEHDTPAARLPNHLSDDVKEQRRGALMEVQQRLAFDWCKDQVGNALEVIVDKPVEAENNVWLARSHADAPDVDAAVFVTGQPKQILKPGDIVPVEIVGHKNYDLIAAAIGAPV